MNNSCKVAACVVTYNRRDKLIKCIEALLSQSYERFSIYIIDNASTDGTYESVESYLEAGKVFYCNTGSNLGGAGGFNYAIRQVAKEYEYIWIMDDDTYPLSNALEELVGHTECVGNEFGFFSSLVEWTDGSACLMNMQKLVDEPYKKIKMLEAGLLPAQNASFVSLFIKSENVKKVGLPIKDFFLWGDDTEYTQRLNQFGGYVIISSVVIHDMGENHGIDVVISDFNRIKRYSMFIRNRMFISKSQGNKKDIIRAYISPFKQCFRVLLKAKDNKLNRIKLILRGFWEGLSFSPEIEYLED